MICLSLYKKQHSVGVRACVVSWSDELAAGVYRRTPRFPRLVTDGVISLARGAPSGYRRGNFWGRTPGIVFAEGL